MTKSDDPAMAWWPELVETSVIRSAFRDGYRAGVASKPALPRLESWQFETTGDSPWLGLKCDSFEQRDTIMTALGWNSIQDSTPGQRDLGMMLRYIARLLDTLEDAEARWEMKDGGP